MSFDIIPLVKIFPKNVDITERLSELCFNSGQCWGIWMFSLNQLVAIKNIINFSFKKYFCLPKLIKLYSGPLFIELNRLVTHDNLSIHILFSEKGVN